MRLTGCLGMWHLHRRLWRWIIELWLEADPRGKGGVDGVEP